MGLAMFGASACSGGASGEDSGTVVTVSARDDACEISQTTLPAGQLTFEVTNDGEQTTEFYVLRGQDVESEVENITPGLSRDLIVELEPGDYVGRCVPGGSGEGIRVDLTVEDSGQAQAETDPALAEAERTYQAYVEQQSRQLVQLTATFADAVRAGDVDRAKELYAQAREPWERIEPVAEAFGGLDPAIDARVNDVAEGEEWTGFHRIEKALWVDGTTQGMAPVADQLEADVRTVVRKADQDPFTALQMAQGSKGLLDEVVATKITGEEDRYSHTDLYDIAANVDGSQAALDALRPVLEERDPDLVQRLDSAFDRVDATLDELRTGDGFPSYDDVPQDRIKQLSSDIAAVSEPVSEVAAVVAGQS